MTVAIDTLNSAFSKTKKLFFPIDRAYWLINLFGGRPGNGFSGGNSYSTSSESPDVNFASFITRYGLLLGIAFIAFFVLMLFFTYLNSVFTFMFIEGVLHKSIKIRKSFRANHSLGLNIFFVKLITGMITIAGIAVILSPVIIALLNGTLSSFNYWLFVPMFLGFFIFFLALIIFWFIVYDFVMPVMYLKNYRFARAWHHVIKKIRDRKGEIGLYWLIKVGLSIALNIATIILAIFVAIILLIPFALIGLGIYFLLLMASQTAAIIVTATYAAVVILLIIYAISVIFVPVAAFFRLWSIEMVRKLKAA